MSLQCNDSVEDDESGMRRGSRDVGKTISLAPQLAQSESEKGNSRRNLEGCLKAQAPKEACVPSRGTQEKPLVRLIH